MYDILDKFDDLMSHLNGEENDMAAEFREQLKKLVEQAGHPFAGGL